MFDIGLDRFQTAVSLDFLRIHSYSSNETDKFTLATFLSVSIAIEIVNICNSIAEVETARLRKRSVLVLFFCLVISLFPDNPVIQRTVREILERKHCAYYHLYREPNDH